MAQNSMAQQFLFAGQQDTQLENHDSPLGTSTSNADQHARNVQLFAQLQEQFSEQEQQQDADGIPQHEQQAPQPFPADLQELAGGAQNGNTQPTPSLNIDLDCQPPNQSSSVSNPQSSVSSIDSDALEDSQSAGSPQLSDQSAVNSTAQGVQQQQHQAPAPWRSSSPTPRHLNQHHHIPFFSGDEKQPPNIPSNPSEEQALLAANKPQAGGERGAFERYFREVYRVWLENKGLPYPQDRIIEGKTVSLVQLFLMVGAFGGHKAVTDQALWQVIGAKIGFPHLAAQGGQPQKARPEVAQTIMDIYATLLSEFEVHWYNALRKGDPGSPIPLPPNLQDLHPHIANLVNAPLRVDSTPQQQISSQANEGPSHPNPAIGQPNAPVLQPQQQQQQIVQMVLQLLQSHPQLKGLRPQELITMTADDWRQRGLGEQEIKLLEAGRPHILAFPQQQQQSSQEQAPVYPTQASSGSGSGSGSGPGSSPSSTKSRAFTIISDTYAAT
ncbi:hypothetical protein FRC02_005224 [Tulasnella sp. 418]|nr:hypothetical protein FRC02_005224 [Tulasnella sp. 418]